MAEKMADMNISQTELLSQMMKISHIENFTCFATGHPFPDKRGLNLPKS